MRMPGHQLEPDDRAQAGAEDPGAMGGDGDEDARHVVGVRRDGDRLGQGRRSALRAWPRRSQVTTVKPSSSGAMPLKTSASPSPGDSRSSVGPWPDTW